MNKFKGFEKDRHLFYKHTGHNGPWGINDRSPIFYLLKLIKEVKIGILRNALLHWIEIFMKYSNMQHGALAHRYD